MLVGAFSNGDVSDETAQEGVLHDGALPGYVESDAGGLEGGASVGGSGWQIRLYECKLIS